jgi:hypothetical protein
VQQNRIGYGAAGLRVWLRLSRCVGAGGRGLSEDQQDQEELAALVKRLRVRLINILALGSEPSNLLKKV